MAEISRSKLFGKLNSLCYKQVEAAFTFAKLRGNPYVELVHWLHQVLQLQDSDVLHIIRHFELNPSTLAADITASLDQLPRGATAISDISSHLEHAVKEGWMWGSLLFNDTKVRSGYMILGLMKGQESRNLLSSISNEFKKVKADDLGDKFQEVCGGSPEDALAASESAVHGGPGEPGEASGAMSPAQMGKQEALNQFTVDLTDQARGGEIDPIVGRDDEIRQIVDILMRRRQNNPLLTGEAGVGKTAVVEGFALRIAKGDVPPMLKDVELRSLDVGMLQAGASMKGEFEQRLKQVIEEVQSSPKPIILFIDEAHTLIGAGGAAGTGDAANLLKPALARGTLRTIAATTWAEYKKHIEKDPALTRRFQVVQVGEPDEEKGIQMMRSIAGVLEKHHRVQVLDEALDSSVRLSHRYIPARQLPDKSVSLLDTACARVAVSQHATPAAVEDTQRRIETLEVELAIIGREERVGIDVGERKEKAGAKLAEAKVQLDELSAAWEKEKALVDKILELRSKLREGSDKPIDDVAEQEKAAAAAATAPPGSAAKGQVAGEGEKTQAEKMKEAPAGEASEGGEGGAGDEPVELTEEERQASLAELKQLQDELAEMQGENPLILPAVDGQAVASVVSDWTGIPVGRMVKNEIEAVLRLSDTLAGRVIGQDHAMAALAKRIQTSRAGLDNPKKPIGVFMLAGTSGVGKTETALALAESLYGGEQNVITINMSEFQEAHTVSTLKGSPPGYVGYGEGGVLTEAVRRRPYSVVLLDEIEKAHGDVHELFFQVFDKGNMEDGEGRSIDFKNTIILLTTNVGSDLIMNMCKDPELMPPPEAIEKALKEPLLKVFPAALLGRLVVIPYYPLNKPMVHAITKLQLGRIQKRVMQNRGIPFEYDESVLDLVAGRVTDAESGGRAIDAILTHTLLPTVSEELLRRLMDGQPVSRVRVGVKDSDFEYAFD